MLFEGEMTKIVHGEQGNASLRLTLSIPEHLQNIEGSVKSSQVQEGKINIWLKDDIPEVDIADEFSSDIEIIQKRLDEIVTAVIERNPTLAPDFNSFLAKFMKDSERLYEATFATGDSSAKKGNIRRRV